MLADALLHLITQPAGVQQDRRAQSHDTADHNGRKQLAEGKVPAQTTEGDHEDTRTHQRRRRQEDHHRRQGRTGSQEAGDRRQDAKGSKRRHHPKQDGRDITPQAGALEIRHKAPV
jgi:hypothetical protein